MQIMKKCKKYKNKKTLRRQLLDKKCKNKKSKTCKKNRKNKNCTCTPAISTSYLYWDVNEHD